MHTGGTTGFSGINSRSNMRTDARLDTKNPPEHLQPLNEGLAEDLTLRGCEELAVAIYEYRDVFSRGPADMSRIEPK